jgi:UDP-N-acetylmuramoyl-L-alanyl-D-glutamate--2,6-diaminopimelate ligase
MEYKYRNLLKAVLQTLGICTDSRMIQPGECFFAIKGEKIDSSIFIDEVLRKGAKFVVTENNQIQDNGKIFYVDNILEALAICAKQFYPHLPKYRLAITGTNGKTSTADYCRQIFNLLNQNAASIGTIGIISNVEIQQNIYDLAKLTSNDLISNYKILSSLKTNDIDYVALEASSIGIEQKRFNKMEFTAAAFTSFGSDHLDYHISLENYLQSKLKLFQENLSKTAPVFLSKEVERQIIELDGRIGLNNYQVIGYESSCDLYINSHETNLDTQKVSFIYKKQPYSFDTEIIGRFQIYNLIFSILLTHSCGFSLEEIVATIPKIKPVKGRLQKIEDPQKRKHIFVDYAHNPDALQKILLELQNIKYSNAKIFSVFGCGGDRDKLKRPVMGKIASELSDYVIITDDNPRTEKPEQIRKEIISGIDKNNYIEIADREKSIYHALKIMNDYDILLIAGKGHEEYQLYDKQEIFFSDADTVKRYFSN